MKNIFNTAAVGHPQPVGLVDRVVSDINRNQIKGYPDSYVSIINNTTGVLKHTIRRLLKSISPEQSEPFLRKMAALVMMKAAIGRPNGGDDIMTKLQQIIHERALPEAFRRLDKDITHYMMPCLDCGRKSYLKYSYSWRKRLNVVVWIAVVYSVAENVKLISDKR
ncbi:MAG: hypothetical protein AB2L12_13525 [Smithellaceae bacterium]